MKATDDPIVRGVRRVRERLSARLGHDLRAIVADIRVRQDANPLLVKRKRARAGRRL